MSDVNQRKGLWRKKSSTWWFKVTFLGWLSDPFKGLSDLQLGDQKVTLNHLVPTTFFKHWLMRNNYLLKILMYMMYMTYMIDAVQFRRAQGVFQYQGFPIKNLLQWNNKSCISIDWINNHSNFISTILFHINFISIHWIKIKANWLVSPLFGGTHVTRPERCPPIFRALRRPAQNPGRGSEWIGLTEFEALDAFRFKKNVKTRTEAIWMFP